MLRFYLYLIVILNNFLIIYVIYLKTKGFKKKKCFKILADLWRMFASTVSYSL